MSELDDIKARAAERRNARKGKGQFGFNVQGALTVAEADLNSAIAIADRAEKAGYAWYGYDKDSLLVQRNEARAAVLALREELRRAGDVLQTAYSAGNELGRCGVSLSPDWPKIQDQSYEEVGEFLYPDITKGGVEFYDRLAETEHYEAFRQA